MSLRLWRKVKHGICIHSIEGFFIIPEFINYEKLETYKNFSDIRIAEKLLITEKRGRILVRNCFELLIR